MSKVRDLLWCSIGLAAACGGEAPEAKAPASPPAVRDSAPPAASPASTAAAVAPAAEPPNAPAGLEQRPKAFRWKDFPGPKVTTTISTKKAWATVPVGLDGNFRVLKIALRDYGRGAGDEHVFVDFDKTETFVPAAFTRPATAAAGLTKGVAIMANVAAASGFGRVIGVEGDMVRLKYTWAGSVSETLLALDEVLVLEDKLSFGHPVAYKRNDTWAAGQLMYTDAKTTWIITGPGAPEQLPTSDVRPMKVQQPYKKGDRVWASSIHLEPAKILEVIDGGVAYKIKYESGGREETTGLGDVTAPLD